MEKTMISFRCFIKNNESFFADSEGELGFKINKESDSSFGNF